MAPELVKNVIFYAKITRIAEKNTNVRAKHGERRPINGFRQAMALQRFKNAKPAGELW